MADGVSVSIGADTRTFDQAVRSGMVDPVQDAQGALEQYTRTGDDAGHQLEGSFRDQQRATGDLQRDIQDLNSTIKEGSKPAYGSAKQASQEFTHKATEGFSEVKESAKTNAIAVGASFTGGMDQAVGGLQGFLAEFLAGFGPGGVIAGVGIAALLGVIQSSIEGGTQAAEAQQQAIADLAGEYIDAGHTGRRSFDNVVESIKAMATAKPEDVIITLQSAFEKARTAGADYQGIVQAIATDSPRDIGKARQALQQLRQEQARNITAAADYANDPNADLTPKLKAVNDLADALDTAERQSKEAARAQRLAASAGLSDFALKQDLLEQLSGAYDDAAGDVSGFLNKEKSVLKVKDYIQAMEERRSQLVQYKEELAKADLSPAAKRFLEGQGAETAAAMLKGYKTASPTQQKQLEEIWQTAGDTSGDTYGAALGKNLKGMKVQAPKIPRPIIPEPDGSRLEAYLRRQQPAITVPVNFVTRNGQPLP